MFAAQSPPLESHEAAFRRKVKKAAAVLASVSLITFPLAPFDDIQKAAFGHLSLLVFGIKKAV